MAEMRLIMSNKLNIGYNRKNQCRIRKKNVAKQKRREAQRRDGIVSHFVIKQGFKAS